jgi:hypothetical protein
MPNVMKFAFIVRMFSILQQSAEVDFYSETKALKFEKSHFITVHLIR